MNLDGGVEIVLELDQKLCSGYSCQYKATPDNCVELYDYNDPGQGFTSTATVYKVRKNDSTPSIKRGDQDCNLDIAMVRLWDFDGWNDDGTLIDETQAAKTYHIPITSSSNNFRKP